MLIVGPEKGRQRPPVGRLVQSALVQHSVLHFRGEVVLVGTRGAQTSLSQVAAVAHAAPRGLVPAIVERGAQIFTISPVVVSRS